MKSDRFFELDTTKATMSSVGGSADKTTPGGESSSAACLTESLKEELRQRLYLIKNRLLNNY
jgi:hypothetical protein